jgi:hypothetical protein
MHECHVPSPAENPGGIGTVRLEPIDGGLERLTPGVPQNRALFGRQPLENLPVRHDHEGARPKTDVHREGRAVDVVGVPWIVLGSSSAPSSIGGRRPGT